MLLSKPQQAAFWRAWQRALFECMPCGTRAEQDTLRRDTLHGACGVRSLKQVGQGRPYAKLMLTVCRMAGDYDRAAYWAVDAERNAAWRIEDCARQIGEIAGVPRGWEYCRGVFAQARLPDQWEDIPDADLESVFRMLDTHRRRLLRREGWRGLRADPGGQPLGYAAHRRYIRLANGTLVCADPAPAIRQLQPH